MWFMWNMYTPQLILISYETQTNLESEYIEMYNISQLNHSIIVQVYYL